MNNLETLLILESLALKRTTKLNNIALDMLLNGVPRKPQKSAYLGELQYQAILDDLEIRQHFKGYMPVVKELHTKACDNSGVEFCICLVKSTNKEDLIAF